MEYVDSLERLRGILSELREKCPWDKKQTISTLRQQTIEETYELAEAITNEDWPGIKEELGDMLLHVLFYTKIAEEKGFFELKDVVYEICEKLVRRHPHVYDQAIAETDDVVKSNWEQIKLKEGKVGVLNGVPQGLPAMVKALRIQEKAKNVGFEWNDKEEVMNKVNEELKELQEAVAENAKEEIENEMGDVLFSLVNYSRYLNIDPEQSLEKTNKKFITRFNAMESAIKAMDKNINDMTLSEMNQIWNEIKQKEK